MDLSPIQNALSSGSYATIADTCDELMLQARSPPFRLASRGVRHQDDWPYAVHLLGYIFVNDLNSARFLWKSMPMENKESSPEVVAVWKIGKNLWNRDYSRVYEAIREFEWSAELAGMVAAFSEKYTEKMFQMLNSAYSTISVEEVAKFLGMSEDKATNYSLQHGWKLDTSCKMLTVLKPITVTSQRLLGSSKLQRLTEYVFHLEH
ncbi:hypothetical protein ZIOFF_060081 [Zingiber officinale]|uniref:CSN8/PSMD8/EIF3K domain-containing protein n=1 Tax=Zingiber officinale TaxID=94328 RepID=A0A8J5FA74_ZINOF|nr:hypothetical protein ZIOFF_060081 [Zingiber officinale]